LRTAASASKKHRPNITRFGDFRLVEEWYERCEHRRVPRLSGASIGDCSPVGCVNIANARCHLENALHRGIRTSSNPTIKEITMAGTLFGIGSQLPYTGYPAQNLQWNPVMLPSPQAYQPIQALPQQLQQLQQIVFVQQNLLQQIQQTLQFIPYQLQQLQQQLVTQQSLFGVPGVGVSQPGQVM
jgi:hypothetical protein